MEPPVPGGGGGTLQEPTVDPVGMTHMDPTQQSPLIVHPPPEETQLVEEHRSCPFASGTHGTPLQQSSADAHVSPALRQVVPRPLQRGTPSASSWHTPELPTPAQQSLRADEMLQA
jgi:hypothetical protein